MIWVTVLNLLGNLLPAIHAARLPIAAALRKPSCSPKQPCTGI